MNRKEAVVSVVFLAYLASCFLTFGEMYNYHSARCVSVRAPSPREAERCEFGAGFLSLLAAPFGPIYWPARAAIEVTK